MSQQGRTDVSTVGWTDLGASVREPGEEARLPTLTLLYHPDLDRIGQRTFLPELAAGRTVLLSRREPELTTPGQLYSRPLDDPHISRQPILLEGLGDGGVEIRTGESRTRVSAHEGPFEARRFSPAEIERGVVLELSNRVVLLLHRAEPPPVRLPPRFGLVGDSAGLVRVRTEIERLSGHELPVLLRGETGTGKELAARALHDSSPRRAKGFYAVNLGAVPPALSATELFGAVRGAFTGSVSSQEGWFRRAHGGTLFLDEIGEAPPEVQVMLLRALETGEIFPLGSQAPHRVDVRVLAATDADLEQRLGSGFKAPLLHRLSGYEIRLPPLRERRDDIGRLLLFFLRRELAASGEEHLLAEPRGKGDPWLAPGLVARLARYDWPGNVRQLRNAVRQIVLGSRGTAQLVIGPALSRLFSAPSATPVDEPTPAGVAGPRRKPGEVSEEELLAALREHRWDLKATAFALRLSRTSLYALIETCPQVRLASDLSPEEIARCHEEEGGNLEAMAERLEVSKRALGRRLRDLGLT